MPPLPAALIPATLRPVLLAGALAVACGLAAETALAQTNLPIPNSDGECAANRIPVGVSDRARCVYKNGSVARDFSEQNNPAICAAFGGTSGTFAVPGADPVATCRGFNAAPKRFTQATLEVAQQGQVRILTRTDIDRSQCAFANDERVCGPETCEPDVLMTDSILRHCVQQCADSCSGHFRAARDCAAENKPTLLTDSDQPCAPNPCPDGQVAVGAHCVGSGEPDDQCENPGETFIPLLDRCVFDECLVDNGGCGTGAFCNLQTSVNVFPSVVYAECGICDQKGGIYANSRVWNGERCTGRGNAYLGPNCELEGILRRHHIYSGSTHVSNECEVRGQKCIITFSNFVPADREQLTKGAGGPAYPASIPYCRQLHPSDCAHLGPLYEKANPANPFSECRLQTDGACQPGACPTGVACALDPDDNTPQCGQCAVAGNIWNGTACAAPGNYTAAACEAVGTLRESRLYLGDFPVAHECEVRGNKCLLPTPAFRPTTREHLAIGPGGPDYPAHIPYCQELHDEQCANSLNEKQIPNNPFSPCVSINFCDPNPCMTGITCRIDSDNATHECQNCPNGRVWDGTSCVESSNAYNNSSCEQAGGEVSRVYQDGNDVGYQCVIEGAACFRPLTAFYPSERDELTVGETGATLSASVPYCRQRHPHPCPDGTYDDDNNGFTACANLPDCAAMDPPQLLQGTTCQASCDNGHGPDEDGVCVQCDGGRTSDGASPCACESGLFDPDANNGDGMCVDQCPAGTENDNGECQACETGMFNPTPGGECQTCINGDASADKTACECGSELFSNPAGNECVSSCDSLRERPFVSIGPSGIVRQCVCNGALTLVDGECGCDPDGPTPTISVDGTACVAECGANATVLADIPGHPRCVLCPFRGVVSDDGMRCECPENTYLDSEAGRCACVGDHGPDQNGNCVPCPGDTTSLRGGEVCACAEDTEPDPDNPGQCRACPPGETAMRGGQCEGPPEDFCAADPNPCPDGVVCENNRVAAKAECRECENNLVWDGTACVEASPAHHASFCAGADGEVTRAYQRLSGAGFNYVDAGFQCVINGRACFRPRREFHPTARNDLFLGDDREEFPGESVVPYCRQLYPRPCPSGTSDHDDNVYTRCAGPEAQFTGPARGVMTADPDEGCYVRGWSRGACEDAPVGDENNLGQEQQCDLSGTTGKVTIAVFFACPTVR